MALLASDASLTTTAALVATGTNEFTSVILQTASADGVVLVGGTAAACTFPVNKTNPSGYLQVDLLPAETLYAKTSSGTATLSVLKLGV